MCGWKWSTAASSSTRRTSTNINNKIDGKRAPAVHKTSDLNTRNFGLAQTLLSPVRSMSALGCWPRTGYSTKSFSVARKTSSVTVAAFKSSAFFVSNQSRVTAKGDNCQSGFFFFLLFVTWIVIFPLNCERISSIDRVTGYNSCARGVESRRLLLQLLIHTADSDWPRAGQHPFDIKYAKRKYKSEHPALRII